MTQEDSKKLEFYVRFKEAYKLDQKLEKKFDFNFGDSKYCMVSNQYIEIMLNKGDGKIKLGNSLFAYYYNKLPDEVKSILN